MVASGQRHQSRLGCNGSLWTTSDATYYICPNGTGASAFRWVLKKIELCEFLRLVFLTLSLCKHRSSRPFPSSESRVKRGTFLIIRGSFGVVLWPSLWSVSGAAGWLAAWQGPPTEWVKAAKSLFPEVLFFLFRDRQWRVKITSDWANYSRVSQIFPSGILFFFRVRRSSYWNFWITGSLMAGRFSYRNSCNSVSLCRVNSHQRFIKNSMQLIKGQLIYCQCTCIRIIICHLAICLMHETLYRVLSC